MMMVVVVMVPAVVPPMMAMPMVMMMAAPMYLCCDRILLRAFLHRSGGAGIAQRKRQRALRRRGDREQCADGGKPENFHHVHLRPPGSTDPSAAIHRPLNAKRLVAAQIKLAAGDVNCV